MIAQTDVDALAEQVPDGALLALPPDYSFVPMALIRALIRRGVKDLHLLAVPISGLSADLLIGAGCVKTMEAAAVTLGEAGLAPCFTRAVQDGAIRMKDSTCPAIHTALQAAEKGVPFMPLGGVIGSDIVKYRDDWKVVDDPMGQGGGRILLLPAITPDVALVHAPLADAFGNVWVGKRHELFTIAHAARTTLATYEELHDGDLTADPVLSAGTIPAMYIGALAQAREGAKPLGLAGRYVIDMDHIRAYAKEARTQEGFDAYLKREVLGPEAEAAS
ncbi:MAG: CoA synthetase [Rhodospirillales bacterium CG15_BIG_FIL_POST_REV_8_21_14_020_66_15]|nr:MAG: CoA synthetase [Rhodospirillales bacterium CG15_BIG_FIL_POST_REV_8_21_14_020_66_15]